jgi:hypothetical protein
MKRINFVSMAFIAVLMVLAVSCTPLQQSQGGYEEAPGSSRVYRSTPYGNRQVVVVERDPYTGLYYQVSPYGYYNGSAFNAPFGYGYGYPAAGGYYRGNVRNGNVRNNGNYRPAPKPQQPPRQTSPTTQKAKDIIRGN